jgi:hypothetical protein
MRGSRLVKLIAVAMALPGAAVAYGLSDQAAAHSTPRVRVAATAADSYYVMLLTNVEDNVYVGTETSLQGVDACDLPDGGPSPCSDPVTYMVELGPYATCTDATAAYNAAAMNPHPAFGGTKVYIFGGSYFIDDTDYWCTPGSSTTTTSSTTTSSSTSQSTVPTGTCPVVPPPAMSFRTPTFRSPHIAQASHCTPAQFAEQKKAFKDRVADAADTAQWVTLGLGACGLLATAVPGAQPFVLPCGLYALLSWGLSIRLGTIARKDPPDPSWRSIVTPRPVVLAVKPAGVLTSGDASALNAVFRAQAVAIAYLNAFMTSVNRASSAAAANSSLWVSRQVAAEQRFALAAGHEFGDLASVSQQADAQLTSLPPEAVSLATLDSEQAQLATKGLPPAFVRLATLSGLDGGEIASLKQTIVSANFSTLAGADPGIMTDPLSQVFSPSEVKTEQDAETSFLDYASVLAAANTPATSSTPPDLTGSWINPQTPTAPPWVFKTADGLRTLTGTFTGGAGHTGLRGTVTATQQSSTVYAGSVHITEGSLSVNGTITITIVNQNEVSVSLKQSNLPTAQVFELDRG